MLNENDVKFKSLNEKLCLSRTIRIFEYENTLAFEPVTTTFVDSYTQTTCYGPIVEEKYAQTEECPNINIKNLVVEHNYLCRSFELEDDTEHFSFESEIDLFKTSIAETECQTIVSFSDQ